MENGPYGANGGWYAGGASTGPLSIGTVGMSVRVPVHSGGSGHPVVGAGGAIPAADVIGPADIGTPAVVGEPGAIGAPIIAPGMSACRVARSTIPATTAAITNRPPLTWVRPPNIVTAAMTKSTIVSGRDVDEWPRPARASSGEPESPSAGITSQPITYSRPPRPPSSVSTGSATRQSTGSVLVARPSAAQTPAMYRP